MISSKKNIFLFWACDYSPNTGEGRLGRKFIYDLKKKNKCKIYQIKTQNFLSKYKYISPFIGIFYLWYFYFKKNKIIYVNYLPMWNFLIFLILPPKTILGPITGGAYFNSSNKINFFIRKIIFPRLYKISELLLNFRFNNYIFSTDLLKKFIDKKLLKKSQFNFVLKDINLNNNKLKNKNIDFLIYYRKHNNKESLFSISLIKNLIDCNFKVEIIGDHLEIKGIKNHGKISNQLVQKLQKKSKFTIASGENIYSIFILECISNGVIILINKKLGKYINFYKNKFKIIDFNNMKLLLKLREKK